eukprot:g2392.t1
MSFLKKIWSRYSSLRITAAKTRSSKFFPMKAFGEFIDRHVDSLTVVVSLQSKEELRCTSGITHHSASWRCLWGRRWCWPSCRWWRSSAHPWLWLVGSSSAPCWPLSCTTGSYTRRSKVMLGIKFYNELLHQECFVLPAVQRQELNLMIIYNFKSFNKAHNSQTASLNQIAAIKISTSCSRERFRC